MIHIIWTNGNEGDYSVREDETLREALNRICKEHGKTTAAVEDWWWVR